MKRYRHYKKDRAIVLSCFGSVIEQRKYLELKEIIEEEFKEISVFIAISSRMVLKHLQKKGFEYKNLPQVLADVDMQGYRNIIVSSINIFPTDEHQVLKNIVAGFNSFSPSNLRATNAILTKTKDTTLFFKELNEKISSLDVANLYIIHGTPKLDTQGVSSIEYSSLFLKELSENNFVCSLEGAFPFYAIKDSLRREIKKRGFKKIQIIPLLLVSGNHYIKDMFEIKETLSDEFEVDIVKSFTKSRDFNLIELPTIIKIIKQNIQEELIKLG